MDNKIDLNKFGIPSIQYNGYELIPNALMTRPQRIGQRLWWERVKFRKRLKFWKILSKYITIQVPMENFFYMNFDNRKIIMMHPDIIDRVKEVINNPTTLDNLSRR
jgi:hypothetical protein